MKFPFTKFSLSNRASILPDIEVSVIDVISIAPVVTKMLSGGSG